MTNRELIAHLSTLDLDALAMVRGYEGGFEDITVEQIKTMEIVLNYHKSDYYGDHEENTYWLIDEEEERQESDNVPKKLINFIDELIGEQSSDQYQTLLSNSYPTKRI